MKNAMISVTEAARRIGVSKDAIKDWGKREILSLTKVGNRMYVSAESVDNIRKSAPELVSQAQAVEALREELEGQAKSCMEDIREYRLEKVLRRESAQRVILYMEIFASLTDLIYEGRFDEREYKAVVMFMKGTPIDDIADKLECSRQTVVSCVRKCNEILFELQPYVRLQEECREQARKLKQHEMDREILLTMLEVYRSDKTGLIRQMGKENFEVLLKPIGDMGFSTRTAGALGATFMTYLGDLVHYGNRLPNLRGLGPHSVREVEEVLATQYGLRMGMRIPGWESIKRAFYGGKDDNVVYEKLFDMGEEAKEYMENAFSELPEERVGTIRSLLQGMYTKGEACKKELEKYKKACEGLRAQIKKQEKRLENGDFFLSPAYGEVKELFDKVEAKGGRRPREVMSEDGATTAEYAMGLLDCIFSQEAVQAEGQRMQADWVKIRKLEKDIRRLQTKMAMTDRNRKRYNEQRKALDLEREEQLAEERDAVSAREAKLENEIERLKELNEAQTKDFQNRQKVAESKLKLLKEELEWTKKMNEKTVEYYADQLKEAAGEDVIRMDNQRYEDLWNTLERYERQADAFNSRAWFRKPWQKLEKFSDTEKRMLKKETD